jgi:PAS domain S-box-containing protein
MLVDRSSREWMQALARLRSKAARLRAAAKAEPEVLLQALDEALALTDAIRTQSAMVQARNAELEAEAQRRDDEMRALLDALPYPIVYTDCAGQIMDVNPAAAALLGMSRTRLKNELLLHFVEDRAGFTDVIRALPRNGAALRATARVRPRDRAPFDAGVTVLRDPRASEQRWLWLLERVSVAQTSAGTPSAASGEPSPSDLCEM